MIPKCLKCGGLIYTQPDSMAISDDIARQIANDCAGANDFGFLPSHTYHFTVPDEQRAEEHYKLALRFGMSDYRAKLLALK